MDNIGIGRYRSVAEILPANEEHDQVCVVEPHRTFGAPQHCRPLVAV
jgi:hypothetical protein